MTKERTVFVTLEIRTAASLAALREKANWESAAKEGGMLSACDGTPFVVEQVSVNVSRGIAIPPRHGPGRKSKSKSKRKS